MIKFSEYFYVKERFYRVFCVYLRVVFSNFLKTMCLDYEFCNADRRLITKSYPYFCN